MMIIIIIMLENHKRVSSIRSGLFFIMSEGLFFHAVRNRTRVPVTAIWAVWLTCEVRTSLTCKRVKYFTQRFKS